MLCEVVVLRDRLLRLVELIVELTDVLGLDELGLGAANVDELRCALVARPWVQARDRALLVRELPSQQQCLAPVQIGAGSAFTSVLCLRECGE